MIPYFDDTEGSTLVSDAGLREKLREGAGEEAKPYLYQDEYQVYYAVLPQKDGWLYAGPMCSARLSAARRRQFYRAHGVSAEDTRPLRAFSLREIADIPILLSAMSSEADWGDEDLRFSQPMPVKTEREIKDDQTRFLLREEEENDDGAYRHTYNEELLLMRAVREGRADDALRIMMDMDSGDGRLSRQSDAQHWKNLSIIGIALCARAAIDGGLPPEAGYRVSGYYIQKCDAARSIEEYLVLRNQAVKDLAQRVSTLLNARGTSGYVARAKDYVRKHYRERIYLEPIAASLGISANYLSKLFYQETGEHLFDFVSRVRVERAANLLLHSEMKLDQIAEYVHFPSQSYFGKMFKRFKGVTPRAFREQNRVKEYQPRTR